jgi:malate dehydrogenase
VDDVAIVGAGELGGAIAHRLAQRDLVSRIRLVDESGSIAAGKALDIMQAAPIGNFATRVEGAAGVTSAIGAPMLVIADRAAGGDWSDEEGLLLLSRLGSRAAKPLVLFAGAGHRELIERGSRELGFPRTRLFGSAPEALVGAIRAIVAIEVNASPRDVALTVLGVPPAHAVVAWEDATIGGLAATRLLPTPSRRRLEARVPDLWPPGPHTLAAAAVCVIEAVLERSKREVSCFVAPDDSAGRRMRAGALPTRLGPGGIASVAIPPLNGRDRVALETAMLL